MDCVYHAYADYMEWLNIRVAPLDYKIYKVLKWWTHGSKPQYTFGGVAPWIINKLVRRHRVRLFMFEYRIYTPEHLIAYAKKYYPAHFKRMKCAIESEYWYGLATSKLTLEPAIYLLLGEQHAIFATKIPTHGMPVAAIKLIP